MFIRILRFYFNKMVKYQNRKRLGFKITGPSRLDFLMSIFPDAQIVNVVRNDVPTISSFLKVGFWKNRGYNKLWWKGAYTKEEINWVKKNIEDSISVTTIQIKKIKDITRKEVDKLKPSYLEIKYEDFIDNPRSTTKSILKFLDLDDDNSCLNAFNELKIYDRNLSDNDYFNDSDLNKIKSILN